MFDPNQFLDQQFTEANSTKRTPCPEGEFTATVEEVKCRQWASKEDPSKSGLTLDVVWSIEDEAAKQAVGRDKVIVRQGVMLEINGTNGLDMGKGKNVGLGRLRAATGLNVPGQPFAFSMLVGRMAKVQVTHRMDGEDIYDQIKAVAPLT